MNAQTTLTLLTIFGLLVTFSAGSLSLFWKGSVDIEGDTRKRLTPFGWLSLGISLVGLLTSAASELIRVNISNNQRLQTQTEENQRKANEKQEARWRTDISGMLAAAKRDIEKNIDDTLRGIEDSQKRFAQTQADIAASRQAILENSLRQATQIIIAGQPLTSMNFRLQFKSQNPALWEAIYAAKDSASWTTSWSMEPMKIGAVVPVSVLDYDSMLLPVLNHLGRLESVTLAQVLAGKDRPASPPKPVIRSKRPQPSKPSPSATSQFADPPGEPAVALIALDQTENAVLSFGDTGNAVWHEASKEGRASTGFIKVKDARKGNTKPLTDAKLALDNDKGPSTYIIQWGLDPITLSNATDRRVTAIAPTAKLPSLLKFAIFYDMRELPFRQNNFALAHARPWSADGYDSEIIGPFQRELSEMTMSIGVNGYKEAIYEYRLKEIRRVSLKYDDGEDVSTACTLFEFELIQ